jgi:hypothetical protein
VTVIDSTSASIQLSQSLAPGLRIAPNQVTVRILPDSTPIRVTSVLPKPLDDSLNRRAAPARDTTARDTTAADTTRPGGRRGIVEVGPGRPRARTELEPLTSRPPLTDRLILRVPQPWKPEGKYEVEIRGLRSVSGVTSDVRGGMTVKPVTAADTTAARGADSLKRRPPKNAADSLKRPPKKRT